MILLSSEQIRRSEQYTLEQEGISGYELMERAAQACFSWFRENIPLQRPVTLVCGMGNNGGDGLALARILLQEGYRVDTYIIRHKDDFTKDAEVNFMLLQNLAPEKVKFIDSNEYSIRFLKDTLIVDAIFGIGINRSIEGKVSGVIQSLNNSSLDILSIDMPSGLKADALPGSQDVIIKAKYTLSFQTYKRSFLHSESAVFAGEVTILDIGLKSLTGGDPIPYQLTDLSRVPEIYKPRYSFGHKGTFGKVMLIGGAYGMTGSISLSARAAAHTGSGLVYIQAPECSHDIVQILSPESIFQKAGTNVIENIQLPDFNVSIGIGPGMGTEDKTIKTFTAFLQGYDHPIVIDADALNILAQQPHLLAYIPPHSILTPHPKEFERLFGPSPNSMERVSLAVQKAKELKVIIILKGKYSIIVSQDGLCYYNATGNDGMATGGSGDVLTGILTGLMAQGYSPLNTAILGTYLHGLAGDIAADDLSKEYIIASDIINYMSKAFKRIGSKRSSA